MSLRAGIATQLNAVLAALLFSACGARSALRSERLAPSRDAAVDIQDSPLRCPPPTPATPPQLAPGEACSFAPTADPDRPVFAALFDDVLVELTRSGELRERFRFMRSPAFELYRTGRHYLVSRGDFLLAVVTHEPMTQSRPYRVAYEMVVVRLAAGRITAHEQWLVESSSFGSGSMEVGASENGILAYSIQQSERSDLHVFAEDGTTLVDVPNVHLPQTNATIDTAGGVFVDRRETINSGTADFSWVDVCRGVTRVAEADANVGSGVFFLRGGAVFDEYQGSSITLERFDVTIGMTLGALAPTASLWSLANTGWVVFGTDTPQRMLVANASSGDPRVVSLVFPPDLRTFRSTASFGSTGTSSTHGGFGVTEDGRVTLGLRNDAFGGLFATADGRTWEQIGLPVGECLTIDYLENAGTYVISGDDMGLLPSDWAPAPVGLDRLDGRSHQLARPASGLVIRLRSPFGASLSADGGCFATLLDSELRVINAVTGQERSVALPRVINPFDYVSTWLPGGDPEPW